MEQTITLVANPVIEKYSPDNNPDDFFCLKVSDSAAEPKFCPGDILIIKKSYTLEYDWQLLAVTVNGKHLLRKVNYDHDEDVFILKDYYGIYTDTLITDEDRFEILGCPVYLQRDLEPVFRKENPNE